MDTENYGAKEPEQTEEAEQAETSEQATALRGIVETAQDATPPADTEDAAATHNYKIGGHWLVAALAAILLGLPALGLAVGNGYIALPVLQGLANETQRRVLSAQQSYAEAANRAAALGDKWQTVFEVKSVNGEAREETTSSFSAGLFPAARVALLLRESEGAMYSYNMGLPAVFLEENVRVPRSVKALVAEYEDLDDFLFGLQSTYSALIEAEAAETEDGSALLRKTLDTYRATDQNEKKHAPYYDYYACGMLADDPETLVTKLAEVKKAGREPWVYEEAEFAAALKGGDYATVERISAQRLARNAEAMEAFIARVRALWLLDKKVEAEQLAKQEQRGDMMRATARIALAELRYRAGDTKDAIALCDTVIASETAKAKTAADKESKRTGQVVDPAIRPAEQLAAVTKSIALLLQGKGTDASRVLQRIYERAQLQQTQLTMEFFCAALAASYHADNSFYQTIASLFGNEGVVIPQAVQDVANGKATTADIFQKGWGVIL